MAKTVIAAEIALDSKQAEQSVGSFRTQLRAATAELVTMSEKFGLSSTEAQNAAKKVAGLKDAIGDAKQLADTFNPDKKFVALGGAIQGVTAGFSAFSGAMGLLGAESKETEKLLLKVQSAMALQQGLSGIAGAVDSFKMLGNTIISKVVTAFSTLRGAIISTGIGALVVGVGILISKLSELQTEVKDISDEFSDHSIEIKKLQVEYRALKGEITDFAKEAELAQIDYSKTIAELRHNTEVEIADATSVWTKFKDAISGKGWSGEITTANTVAKIKADAAKKEADAEEKHKIQMDIINQKYANKKLEDAQRDADKLAAIRTAGNKKSNDADDAAKKEQEDALKKFNELKNAKHTEDIADTQAYFDELAAIEAAEAQKNIDRLRTNQENELQAKADLAELALLDDPDSTENKLLKMQADFDLEMAQFEGNEVQRQIKVKEYEDKVVDVKKQAKDAKKAIIEEEINQVQVGLAAISGALDGFAELAGKDTAAGKALAIASSVIKTIQGGISAYMGVIGSIPGPWGIALGAVAAAGVVASGYASIKKMKAIKVPGGSSGPSVPNVDMKAPILPTAQTTRLDQQSINQVGNAANRAYVLESDVSGNQERITRLNRAARIN